MDTYSIVLLFLFIISPVIFLLLLFVTAPYGRHVKKGWGISINNKLGWVVMEIPAVLTILIIYLTHFKTIHPVNGIFLLIWQFHYLYRTFYFPFQIRASKKSFPVAVVLSAVLFNIINGYLNGESLFARQALSGIGELNTLHFWMGLLLFLVGFIIHFISDRCILNLRKTDTKEYAIPKGGLFNYVSNPNYFGEFLQWCGWAILTWSLAGLAFALFTLANLLPRGIANHKWYKEKFADYPVKRKIFFPGIF